MYAAADSGFRNAYVRGLVLLALIPALSGCAGLIERRAEKSIRGLLEDRIGPARAWHVNVRGDTGGLTRGQVDVVQVEGVDVRATAGLNVRSVRATLNDVAYDRKRRQVTRIGSSAVAIAVDQPALNEYLLASRRSGSLTLALRRDGVHARGHVRLLGIRVPFELEGQAKPSPDGREIIFDPSAFSLVRLNLPVETATAVGGLINPVLSAETLGLPIRFRSVEVSEGAALVRGELLLPPGGLGGGS